MYNIKFRHTVAAVPAFIFWAVSLTFFVMGLSFGDQTGYIKWIGIALAFAFTFIQLIGWDTDPNELGPLMYYTWLASYVVGIGTNIVSLLNILHIPNVVLEWLICGGLSFLIEVSPERLFVLAWRSISPKTQQPGQLYNQQRGQQRGRQQGLPQNFTTVDEYMASLRTQKQNQQDWARQQAKRKKKPQQQQPSHQSIYSFQPPMEEDDDKELFGEG